jgi:hypothetical protein
MKIAVYQIDSLKPKTEEEYQDFCDIFNLPSLKYGAANFIGEFSHYITKTELKKSASINQKFYNKKGNCWVEGFLLMQLSNTGNKLFAFYIS